MRSARGGHSATLVGARTWGGVFGCGETQLVDGTVVVHPAYAMHVHGEGWALENRGVEPDVAVPIAPHDAAAGHARSVCSGATCSQCSTTGPSRRRRSTERSARSHVPPRAYLPRQQ